MKRARLSTLFNFEDLLLHKPILSRLLHYLPPIAFRELWSNSARLFRVCETTPQLHFYECLKYALLKVFDDNKNVVNGMLTALTHGYSLTGGFLLYVLNGDYTTIQKDLRYDLDFVAPANMQTFADSPVHVLQFALRQEFQVLVDPHYEDSDIDCIFETRYNHRKVSTIYLNCDVRRYISSFDFDFCKNIYYKNQLYIKHSHAVLSRRCVVNATSYLKSMRSLDIARLYEYAYPKIVQRIEKYANRNYMTILCQTGHTEAWDYIADNIALFVNEESVIRGTTCQFTLVQDYNYRLVTNQFCRVWAALWRQCKY